MEGLQLPSRIRLETPNYVLRTLTEADANPRWGQWSADAEAMAMLNLRARASSVEELRRYIRSFDNHSRCLLGIFTRAEGLHVGVYTVRLDHEHRTLTYTLLIGEPHYRGRHVHTETRVALNDFFFDVVGVEKAAATVVAGNAPIIRNLLNGGWTQEGHLRGHGRSPVDGARIDLLQFGLLREEWHAWKRRHFAQS